MKLRTRILVVSIAIAALLGCQKEGQETGSTVTPNQTLSPEMSPSPTPSIAGICDWDNTGSATDTANQWWQDDVFYEIFVRSYQDSNDDGVGDLRGITSRLDYVQQLGISGLWLTPIFASPSDHGYDVTDYYAINPDFGTLDDLLDLLEQAHARGIKVILDLVLNHSSAQHPFFQSAWTEESSPYRDFYVWSKDDRGEDWYPASSSYYYAAFYGGMPDLNYYSDSLTGEMARVIDYWIDLGVDGYRLDAIKYLVEQGDRTEHSDGTHCYLKGLRRYIQAKGSESLILGEVWDDTQTVAPYYGNGFDELLLAFDFSLSDGIYRSVSNNDSAAFLTPVANREYYLPSASMAASFLRNHDMDRTGSVFPSLEQLKMAAAIQFSLSATPFIYYGEEIGMTGERGSDNHDNARRSPMQWNALAQASFTCETCSPWYPVNSDYPTLNVEAQRADSESLWNYYQKLLALRRDSGDLGSDLRSDDFSWVTVENSEVLAYLRGNALLVVLNFNSETITNVTLDLNSSGTFSGGTDTFSGEILEASGTDTFSAGPLEPYAVRWYVLQP